MSARLCRRLSDLHPNVHLVPNAVDDALLEASADADLAVPADIAHVPRPIIGCVTRIVPEYFDAALMRHVALARPNWSLVIVGPEHDGRGEAKTDLLALKEAANAHFTGLRPFGELPGYLKAMDVCVIPYRLTRNKQAANPLKVYEYLAAGKPVVSVPLELTDDVAALVDMARGTDEWVTAIERALTTDTAQACAHRREVARANTWDRRVAAISALLVTAREARRGRAGPG